MSSLKLHCIHTVYCFVPHDQLAQQNLLSEQKGRHLCVRRVRVKSYRGGKMTIFLLLKLCFHACATASPLRSLASLADGESTDNNNNNIIAIFNNVALF
jgi:hypothetical protein